MTSYKSTFQIRQVLRTLGFSGNEIKIVSFLFYKKRATARDISEEIELALSSVEYCVAMLVSKGVLKNIAGKEDVFEICSEKKFLEWIEQQKETNQSIYNNAQKGISDFLSSINGDEWEPKMKHYKGKEKVVELYNDMIDSAAAYDGNIYSWLDIQSISDAMGKDVIQNYITRRMRKGVISHDIVPRNKRNLEHHKKKEMREIKFVDVLPIDGELRIYADKVAVITFSGREPIGIVLDDPIIFTLFKSIFQSSWMN